jgi:hypothetical protein
VQYHLNRLVAIATSCAVLVPSIAGCQAYQVANKVVGQTSTISEVQYRQVIDNLAMAADNPGALPYFGVPASTRSTIQRSATASVGLAFTLLTAATISTTKTILGPLFGQTYLSGITPMASGTQQNIQEFDASANIDPVRQIVMQVLLHNALGIPNVPYRESVARKFFFAPDPKQEVVSQTETRNTTAMGTDPTYRAEFTLLFERIRPGWVGVGRRRDVPMKAAYVGHRGNTYVWVMPQDLDHLTDLTIAVVDISTANTSETGSSHGAQPTLSTPRSFLDGKATRDRVAPTTSGGNTIAPAPP